MDWQTELTTWLGRLACLNVTKLSWEWPFGRYVDKYTSFLQSVSRSLKTLILYTGSDEESYSPDDLEGPLVMNTVYFF